MNENIVQYKNDETASYERMFKIKTSFIMELVTAALHQIVSYLEPKSSMYLQPDDTPSDSVEQNLKEMWRGYYKEFNGQRWYLALWAQVELLMYYATMRNENYDNTKSWMVGEEKEIIVGVYHALVFAHNWKVDCIYKTHQKHGKNFGSATGWQTIDITEAIKDWPEKYNFEAMAVIELLPKDVPGYMDKDVEQTE